MIHVRQKRYVLAISVFAVLLSLAAAAYADPAVSMDLTVSPTSGLDVNGNLDYAASVTNLTGSDIAVSVTFTLSPADLPISPSPSGGCIFTPGSSNLSVVCSFSPLASGATHEFDITVHPTQVTPRDVTALAHTDGFDDVSGFVTSSITEVGLSEVMVSLTSTNPGKVGEALVYNVTVLNIQDDDAGNVYALLALPSKVTFVSASRGCTRNILVTCKFGSLGVGQSKTATITVLPTVSGWTQATAGVRLSTADSNFLNNSAATSVWVNP